MDVIASLPADAETSEAVEPGDGALGNPAVNSLARTVKNTAAGDDGLMPRAQMSGAPTQERMPTASTTWLPLKRGLACTSCGGKDF